MAQVHAGAGEVTRVLDRIRRVTRDGRWIPEIDGLRFIAIIAVVLFHLNGELSVRAAVPVEPRYLEFARWMNNGDRGVELFFVISGMILAMPFARHYLGAGKPLSLRKFYLRRVTRLEPPYLLSIVLFTVMVALYGHGHLPAGFGRHAWAGAFYLHSAIFRAMNPVNMVSWSLEVEIQFYLLAPLFMQLLRIRGKLVRRVGLGAAVLAIGLAQARWGTGPGDDLFLLHYVQFFIAGLLLADVFVLDLEGIQTSWMWDGVALAGLLLVFGISRGAWWAHTVLPFLLVPVCLAAMRSRVFRGFCSTPWIAVIGGMCYSIYLLHFALMAAFFKLTRHLVMPRFDYLTVFLVQTVVLIVPILACSTVFFLLVERPCMDPDWPGHLWRRVTGRSEHDVALLDTAGVTRKSD